MRSISVDVDIDLDDIIHCLYRKSDQIELLEMLLDAMDTKTVLDTIRSHENYEQIPRQVSAALIGDDITFTRACALINANRWRLSLDQEQLILQIADKL
jgi:hypothetical protein